MEEKTLKKTIYIAKDSKYMLIMGKGICNLQDA